VTDSCGGGLKLKPDEVSPKEKVPVPNLTEPPNWKGLLNVKPLDA